MNFKKISLVSAALALAAPMFASTYFGGHEDTNGRSSDNDFNDIVFSLSGNGLTLKTGDGNWYTNPTLATSGNPFWNNASGDGPKMNVGYCIYGGGNCNGGVALDPNAPYLANKYNPAMPANDVYFSVSGEVSANVSFKIASQNDVLGWYDSTGLHFINAGGSTGTFTFNPSGDFGLFGTSIVDYKFGEPVYGDFYFSQSHRDASNFAFFATPEPGTMTVMGIGLLAVGALFRRRNSQATQN